jgi:hypothetical protein
VGVAVILRIGSWPNLLATFEFMHQCLKDLGYIEEENIGFEFRWAGREGANVMRSFLKISCVALALSIVFMSLATVASAGPKEDVAAATLAWTLARGEDDPDMMLSLYSDDAALWRTLSPTLRADRVALRDYFVTRFKVLPSLKLPSAIS